MGTIEHERKFNYGQHYSEKSLLVPLSIHRRDSGVRPIGGGNPICAFASTTFGLPKVVLAESFTDKKTRCLSTAQPRVQ
jgi:hypothetical protein